MDPATHAHSRRIQIARETLVDLVKLFGFYPADSVIINWMKAAELVLAQRVDVEVFLEPTDLSKSDLELFIAHARSWPPVHLTCLTCLTYMDERIYSGIEVVQEALAKYEIEVKDVFVFAGDHVFSRECDEGCEPHLVHVEKQISRVSRESQCDSDSSVSIDAQAFPVVPSVEDLSPWQATESAFVQHLLGQHGHS